MVENVSADEAALSLSRRTSSSSEAATVSPLEVSGVNVVVVEDAAEDAAEDAVVAGEAAEAATSGVEAAVAVKAGTISETRELAIRCTR